MMKYLKHIAWLLPTIVALPVLIIVTMVSECPVWFSGMLFGLGLAYGFAVVSLERWINFIAIKAVFDRAFKGGK